MEMQRDQEADMEFSVDRVTDIQVFPYFGSVSLEVSPCLSATDGSYARGGVEVMAYEALNVEGTFVDVGLQAGATYVAACKNDAGVPIQTHWMYCTQVAPDPAFGISRNHRVPGIYAPAPFLDTSLFVSLEPLRDIVGVDAQRPTDLGVSEFKLSNTGDLIATAFGAPHALGIRIEDPFLPPHFLTGARNLSILAKSGRTGQSFGLTGLKCVSASSPAIFIQEDGQ